jgi:Acetyltransferase (GNAT) family
LLGARTATEIATGSAERGRLAALTGWTATSPHRPRPGRRRRAIAAPVKGPLPNAEPGTDLTGSSSPERTHRRLGQARGHEDEAPVQITVVGSADLPELLPLARAYCDFYQVTPSDRELLALSRALLADPQREGLQLLARDDAGRAVGFATLYWSWQTLVAARVGVMNDLFVAPQARGMGWPRG